MYTIRRSVSDKFKKFVRWLANELGIIQEIRNERALEIAKKLEEAANYVGGFQTNFPKIEPLQESRDLLWLLVEDMTHLFCGLGEYGDFNIYPIYEKVYRHALRYNPSLVPKPVRTPIQRIFDSLGDLQDRLEDLGKYSPDDIEELMKQGYDLTAMIPKIKAFIDELSMENTLRYYIQSLSDNERQLLFLLGQELVSQTQEDLKDDFKRQLFTAITRKYWYFSHYGKKVLDFLVSEYGYKLT